MLRSWTSRLVFSLALILSLTVSVGNHSQVSAQSEGEAFTVQVYEGDLNAYNAALEDCGTPSLECLVHYTFTYTAIEMSNRIVGVNLETTPTTGDATDEYLQKKQAGVEPDGSLVGGLNYMMGQMFKRPVARTSTYVADLMDSMNIATPAQAQGLGFTALDPILDLWKIFRNLAYVFFVIVLLILGFMIMFRRKIGGQAAVTAQQAIPSVIIALVFVTFSYAIAGFLIDLMYLGMFMVVGLFESTKGFQDNIINFNIIELMFALFSGAANPTLNMNIVDTFIEGLTDTAALQNIVGFLGGLTLSLVVAIAVLIGTVKLFLELLKAYAEVVLHTVTAPIILMFGAIPGKGDVFTGWIRKIVGNLIPFPIVLVITIMFYFFTENIGASGAEGGFIPPFLFGRGQASTIASLMGLALILAMPDMVKHYKEEIAGKGGIGELIYSSAKDSVRGAWSNKYVGLGGGALNSAGKIADYATLPARAGIGATVGALAGRKRADQYGATGWRRAATILTGASVGAGVGVKAPQIAKEGFRGLGKQGRDTAVELLTHEFKAGLKSEQSRERTAGEQQVAESQKSAMRGTPTTPISMPSISRGPNRGRAPLKE